MDLIKDALAKAKVAQVRQIERPEHLDRQLPRSTTNGSAAAAGQVRHDTTASKAVPPSQPLVKPDFGRLEKNRIVSFAMTDPDHIAFNVLRTKVQRALRDNGWKTLAITSPTANCGKTTVAINLALSLARQPHCRTVLVDLDLGKAGIADALGISAENSIGSYLEGEGAFEDCFVRLNDNLTIGLNLQPVHNPAEKMHDHRLRDMLKRITDVLAPDVLIFDLPPMLAGDEAIAFLPHADASLLVIAGGETTAPQVEDCERHLHGNPGYLGVVLNKTGDPMMPYYHRSK